MEINILFVIVVLILAAGAAWGWKRGLLESVVRIVSCILGILVVIVIAKGIGSFSQKRYVQVIMALLLRAIPVGRLADKLAGALLGLAESVLVIWSLLLLIGVTDLLGLNDWIKEQVGQSRFLMLIYYNNYMIELLKKVLY